MMNQMKGMLYRNYNVRFRGGVSVQCIITTGGGTGGDPLAIDNKTI